MQNSTIETSIFSDYENIILIFFEKVFLMLWCKSWGKAAHFFCLQKWTILRKKRGLYYSTNNWKNKSVIKKYGCKLKTRGWDMFYQQLFSLSISDHLFYKIYYLKNKSKFEKKLLFVITWIFTRALWTFFI